MGSSRDIWVGGKFEGQRFGVDERDKTDPREQPRGNGSSRINGTERAEQEKKEYERENRKKWKC